MAQQDKSLTQLLAEIGVSHEPSKHHGCRRLITERGTEIDHADYMRGLALVRRAEAAA